MNFPVCETLKFDLKAPGIACMTISRPEALNALSAQVLKDLETALTWASEQSLGTLRALILTGSGEKAFVAGADIKEISTLDQKSALEFANRGQKVFRKIETLKIPVVAAVNGFALGGGCELALSCDYIYASENAKFGLPEVTLGLIPGFGGTVRLAKVIGPNRARELTYTGEMLDASEALRVGLVNKVLPQAQLLETLVASLSKMTAKVSPLAVSHAKKTVLPAFDLSIDQAMTLEAQNFAGLFGSNDTKEGTTAFVEKRKAVFNGL